MISSTFARARGAWRPALFLALAATLILVYLRNHGLYPAVFADEWYYSKMSRLMPLADSLLPSYLYLWLFSATNACGAGFLECARAGNLLLFAAGLPFVYLVARRFATPPWAGLITLLAAAAPLNVYTMYFMPETTYWFGFCLLSWIVLTRTAWRLVPLGLDAGIVLGAMSLVKVHALFLTPALGLYLLYASWLQGGATLQWLARGLGAALAATVVTVALKFGLGWLLAGDAGLSLLGPFYQGNVSSGSTTVRASLLAPVLTSALGHLMALAVLLAVPLGILVHGVATGSLGRSAPGANRLHAYVLLMLGAALGMTVVYTATLADRDAVEGMRLHLRYYNFVFPLLWLVVAASLRTDPGAGPRARWLRWALALVLGLLVLLAFNSLPAYAPSIVDGPDIASINMRSTSGHVTVVLQLALLAAWASGRFNAARLFLLVLLPITVLIGQDRIAKSASAHRASSLGDRAGALVLATVPAAERGRIILAGADAIVPHIMRAQFTIDRADTTMLVLPEGAPVPMQQITAGQQWLLVLGQHAAPLGIVMGQTDEMTLLRLPQQQAPFVHASLAAPLDGGPFTKVEGLSVSEPWGRWSDAKQVVFHFEQPLPRGLVVVLKARAFGINATLPFTLRVGDQATQFSAGPGFEQINLYLTTDGAQRSLSIEVPQPTSPEDIGTPGDPRKLGIGISELSLRESRVPAPLP